MLTVALESAIPARRAAQLASRAFLPNWSRLEMVDKGATAEAEAEVESLAPAMFCDHDFTAVGTSHRI